MDIKKAFVIFACLFACLFMATVAVADEPVLTYPKMETIRWDDVAGTTIYIGWAEPGATTGTSQWKIARMVYTGADWVLDWADGDTLRDNEWDNRATTVVYN